MDQGCISAGGGAGHPEAVGNQTCSLSEPPGELLTDLDLNIFREDGGFNVDLSFCRVSHLFWL